MTTKDLDTIDYTAMEGGEMCVHLKDDGARWAEAFCQHAKKLGHHIDKEWMVGWFANAIETSNGYRNRQRRQ